jgi:hypothetical protein
MGLGFDQQRILQLAVLPRREGQRGWDGAGLNVFELYRHIYQEEFQLPLIAKDSIF